MSRKSHEVSCQCICLWQMFHMMQIRSGELTSMSTSNYILPGNVVWILNTIYRFRMSLTPKRSSTHHVYVMSISIFMMRIFKLFMSSFLWGYATINLCLCFSICHNLYTISIAYIFVNKPLSMVFVPCGWYIYLLYSSTTCFNTNK